MMTKGEYRVGKTFNPSGDEVVAALKSVAADFIDLIESIPSDRDSAVGNERGRLKALAQTEIESAAMWAVKAATKRAEDVAVTGQASSGSAMAVKSDPFASTVKAAVNKYRNDPAIHTTLSEADFVQHEMRKHGFMSVSDRDLEDAILAVGT